MFWPATAFSSRSAINRRSFLLTTGSLAAASVWASRAEGFVRRHVGFGAYPFSLGVAAGDPAPDGFVIWTRLAPKPLEGGGMPPEAVEVDWQVAEDEQMTKVVRSGKTVATPDWGHSVHVEVAGLRPDRWYFYQFRAGGEISPVGRSRTFPAADALADRLRFAFASCQHYEYGHFTAYEHMCDEELDFVVHLGDYIYEGKASEKKVRKHNSPEIDSVEDYRNRHALYKSDAALQAAHQQFPWLVAWDDHEFDNNYANDVSEQPDVAPEEFLLRRARAYQVYYEHMPLRRTSLPHGPEMPIYRRVPFGRRAEFFVLDTRQYRTDQPCGDGRKEPCEAVYDPQATLLGDRQEQWLVGGLTDSAGRWNVLAQQVMMARVDRGPGDKTAYSMDQWPGYEVCRRRLLKSIHDCGVSNPLVLTGDIHSNWANDLIADFDDLDSQVVASEFVGTSITSGGDGTDAPKYLADMLGENPFVKFHNTQRGYVACELTPAVCRADYRVVEYVTRPGSPIATRASFVIEDGKRGLQKA
ncbi:MAG TPA: alkaline phosphatase D family protein [Pirellulales bacterium]|nr:alkaline phosphatase D family protein [Pirellulales bacterium]